MTAGPRRHKPWTAQTAQPKTQLPRTAELVKRHMLQERAWEALQHAANGTAGLEPTRLHFCTLFAVPSCCLRIVSCMNAHLVSRTPLLERGRAVTCMVHAERAEPMLRHFWLSEPCRGIDSSLRFHCAYPCKPDRYTTCGAQPPISCSCPNTPVVGSPPRPNPPACAPPGSAKPCLQGVRLAAGAALC